MAEIIKIHLTDEAFDKMLKNIQSGGIFVPNKEENSDLKLENDNPTTDELQSRVRSLYERFLKFKEDEKQLGIKKIEFEYPNFENQIKSGARTSISDYESELFEICPLVKTYPSASTLIAKVLMSEDLFNSLFSSSN